MKKTTRSRTESGGTRDVSSAWIVVATVLCILIGVSLVQEAKQPEPPAHPSVERQQPNPPPAEAPVLGRYGSV